MSVELMPKVLRPQSRQPCSLISLKMLMHIMARTSGIPARNVGIASVEAARTNRLLAFGLATLLRNIPGKFILGADVDSATELFYDNVNAAVVDNAPVISSDRLFTP